MTHNVGVQVFSMGKSYEELEQSREFRAKVIEEFGKVPDSIMTHNRNELAMDVYADERSYKSVGYQSDKGKQWNEAFGISSKNCRFGALSRFSQNVGRTVLRFYSKEGDIVVDPFAGHNSRMELCWKAGRNYYGQDVSVEFMKANEKVRDILLSKGDMSLFPDMFKVDIVLKTGDSRSLQFDDEFADFTITSPPYWNLEYYGDEEEQLGRGTYLQFLGNLGQVMRENYRVLKTGAYCCWFVNDFRKDGMFYSYHTDVIVGMEDAGFTQEDMIIVDLGQPIRSAFASQVMKERIIPKRHEYCIVFRK